MEKSNIVFESNSKQTTFEKFGKNQWAELEKPYDDKFTYTVLNEICKLGNPNHTQTGVKKLLFCGDDIYLEKVRPKYVSIGLLTKKEVIKSNKPKPTKNKKKGKKK